MELKDLRFDGQIFNLADQIALLLSAGGRILDASAAAVEAYGYSVEELRSMGVQGLRAEDEHELAQKQYAMASASGMHFQTIHRRADGTAFRVDVRSIPVQVDGKKAALSIIDDITEKIKTEKNVVRLKRVYEVLSLTNEALVNLREPQSIFDEACRIMVEAGGFKMAWVGLLSSDESTVNPVAFAGHDESYFKAIHIIIGDEIYGQGPVASAITLGHQVVCLDIFDVDPSAPWRAFALEHGYRSLAAFPITRSGKVIGAYMAYAEEPSFFEEQEIEILSRLATNISAALELSEQNEQRKHAECELRESERWLKESQRVAQLGHYDFDIESNLWECSEPLYDVLGISERYQRDFAGWLEIVHPDDRLMFSDYFEREVLRNNKPFDLEYRIIRPVDLVERILHGLGTVDYSADGHPLRMFGVLQDITDIWAAQKALKEFSDERERHLQQLDNALSSTVDVLVRVCEERDPYTAGHQRRVSQLAAAIASEMGMSESEIADLKLAGLIHDVGKVSVPAEILTKPRSLTEIEYELVKMHVDTSYKIISKAHMPGPIAEFVYMHHERCDGSGYPRGLKCAAMPLGAKVLMVADVVEAMASHRPYRPSLGMEAALAEIERGSGTVYDPGCCTACLKLIRQDGFEFLED